MRKKEKEVTDQTAIEAIIQDAAVCRLGLVDNGEPYIVPMNFGYSNGRLFFHSAKEGRKLDVIRSSSRVCFELESGVEVIGAEKPCGWTTRFSSVIGYGRAYIVEDAEEKKAGLDVIMRHYAGPGDFAYPPVTLEKTAIILVEVESMTAKRSE
ncbi:MAG: pyridoxamine 5'-phosphate oxidase family protein [Firmicutes bacterium]|nr:pyridoxamine 5'-phosphate oxidase family protein [Bacillota bacterium]